MKKTEEKSNLIAATLISLPVVCVVIAAVLSVFPGLRIRGGSSSGEFSAYVYLIAFIVGAIVSFYGWHYLVKNFKCSDCGNLFYNGTYSNIRKKSCSCCNK